MFTRHLKSLYPQITQKQLEKLKIKFRKQFSKQLLLNNIKKDHYEIIKMKSWLKSQGWFDWTIWKPVFIMMDQAPVERIYFSNFRNPDILYDIVHISFPKLRQLHLEDNLISSIQPIVGLNMPHLKKLNFKRNLIISIKCLKRCEFPALNQINLSDNLLQSCQQLAQMYMPILNKITLQQKTYLNIYMIYQQGQGQRQLKSTSNVNGYDLRWILKLQTKKIQFIKYSADARIIRKEMEEQIGEKYYKIRVEKKGMDFGSLLPLMSF